MVFPVFTDRVKCLLIELLHKNPRGQFLGQQTNDSIGEYKTLTNLQWLSNRFNLLLASELKCQSLPLINHQTVPNARNNL